jgi:malate dehydrogenase
MKVVIFGGAGGIGSSVAFNLLLTSTPYDVVVVDSRPNMVTSHVMDMQDALAFGGAKAVRGGDAAEARDADVIVLCAAVPLRLNSSRSLFLAENAAIVEQIVVPLVDRGWPGVLIMMTNPIDALATWLYRQGRIDPGKVIGYTVNDSLRLRTGVSRALNVRSQDVDGWVLGEHGEGQVPLYSRIQVAGQPVTLTTEQRAVADEYMTTWYARHVALDSGRASTWSSGLGTARLVDAMATGSPDPWPGSTVLTGQYGIDGVSVGVPLIVGPSGVEKVVEWELAEDETAALHLAADKIRAAADTLERARADG